MRFLCEAGPTTSELELQPGSWTVGGGLEDGVRLPGLSAGLIALEITETNAWVRSAREVVVGRAPLRADTRRLLLPGEAVELGGGLRLRRPAQTAPIATLALLQSWVREGGARSPSAAAELVCVAGQDAPAAFPLVGGPLELGRHPDCAITLQDRAISRRHARLVQRGNTHRLEDLGGPNPTRRNGRRLRAPSLLEEGDVIEIGRTLLRYVAAEQDSPAAREAVQNVRRLVPGRRLPRPLRVMLLGLLSGGTVGWLALTASARARPAPPATPSAAGAGRRSW
jgi:hypothetical protein